MSEIARALLPGERYVSPSSPDTIFVPVPHGHVAVPIEKIDADGNRVTVVEFVKAGQPLQT